MGFDRRTWFALLVAATVLLPAGRAAALVDGITYAGSNCVGSNWEAEHFAGRGVNGDWTGLLVGVNDQYKCAMPSRPLTGAPDLGSRVTMSVRGPANCVLWVASADGVFLDASFRDTGTVSPGAQNLLTFDQVGVGLDQDETFTISCIMPAGSVIDSYTFMRCLDAGCSPVEQANVCGNGLVEAGEACDDGNRINGDACSNMCVAASCHDNAQNEGETAIDCGGPNCDPCSEVMPLSSAVANGAAQMPASNATDGNLSTRYASDGNLPTASITFHLASAGEVTGLRLAMYQGATRTYPLTITVNGAQVYNANTQTAADYWNVSFPATQGDTVTVTMTGANSSGNNFLSIWEAQVLGFHAPTCTDGVQNHGELGVDCGGPCSTPCGEQPLESFSAVALGTGQSPAYFGIDGDLSTRYTNDNTIANAKLTVQLQQAANINGLQLLMYNGANRTYPIQIAVGNSVVFTGNTAISAGYWPVSFASTVGDKVSVSMTGPNSAGTNWFSVFEANVKGTPLQTGPATCSDGLLTPGEDGVDCGGVCPNKCLHVLTPLSATASSIQGGTWDASKAIDGSATTRWSSAFSDPQWLSVDLGTSFHIEQVNVHWETATSADYDIQVSQFGGTGPWTTLRTLTNPTTGPRVDQAKYLGAMGRYVRIYSRARTTNYGDSIYELETLGY